MPNDRRRRIVAALLLGLLAIGGCAQPNPMPDYSPIRTEVERLYLNYHELKVVYSDLRAAARLHIERSGGQLSEIQTAARFIDQANLIAYYQWELLSITEYIRENVRSDFFTLRVKDLADARQKSADIVLAIKVYDAFIKDPEALAVIQKGIWHIEQNMLIFDALHDMLQPLSNRPDAAPALEGQESL